MEKGIVCKVWNIKGTTLSKGAIDQLRDSVGYILNSEKTLGDNHLDSLNQLKRECKYIENDLKTFSGAYVGGHNVSSTEISKAVSQMMEIKRFYGKEDGRAALHMIISLPEEESNIANASKLMQLCDSVVKEVFPNNQAVYAVHTNTENLHVHIILNSVGLDGKKIHQNDKFMRDVLHPCVNKYAAVYGFAQNPKWKTSAKDNLSFPEIKMALRSAIDKAIEKSDSFEDFIDRLGEQNILVRTGKYISLSLPEMRKPVRTHNLGMNYTRDVIVERILTRKEKFIHLNTGNYTINGKPEDIYTPTIFRMPKYKEMSSREQKEVVHQLRLGKNPWRENSRMNWQLNRIADDLNASNRIHSYIDFYSPNGTIESALEKMIEAKKQAAYDKKLIQHAKRKYKPILDIYDEMKSIEKKSYLYEYKGHSEYRPEFEKYRELTRRLKDGYNKDVFEVAAFLQECDERLLYAQAQINEISEEYREMKKYALQKGISLGNSNQNLFDLLGYYDTKNSIKSGIAEADSYYISSPHSSMVFRINKYPSMDQNGHLVEQYDVAVLDGSGKILHQIKGNDSDRNFKTEMDDLQEKYNLVDCKRFSNFNLAAEYSDKKEFSHEVKEKSMNKAVYFLQGVNHVSDEKKTNILVSPKNSNYLCLVIKEEEKLKITVLNRRNTVEEVFWVPVVKEKNQEGFLTLNNLMDRYDFHDEIKEFETLDEANKYLHDSEKEITKKYERA